MKRILFVDDEPNILDGLKRMLRPMRAEWEMSFAASGKEALEILDSSEYDALVTDLQMPGMNGAELMEAVRDRHPRVIRLVLTGQVGQDIMFRSIELAHQIMSKPCDPETLKGVVSRSSALHDLLEAPHLKQMISGLDSLPSLPHLYLEIMKEIKSPSSSMNKIGRIVESDLSMSAKVLHLVNSAFFALPRRISSPAQAAVMLGLENIRALVLSTHLFSELSVEDISSFGLERLWEHSQRTAALAKAIATVEKLPAAIVDAAFMGGMLHDIGKLVLASNLTDRYLGVIGRAASEKLPVVEIECQELGVSHAIVGGYLLGLWGFSDPVVEAVCLHHDPERSALCEPGPLMAVHAANWIEIEASGGQIAAGEGLNLDYIGRLGKEPRLPIWRELCNKILTGESEK